jgi:hypothetical protein
MDQVESYYNAKSKKYDEIFDTPFISKSMIKSHGSILNRTFPQTLTLWFLTLEGELVAGQSKGQEKAAK